MGKIAEEWQETLWNNLLEKLVKLESKNELQKVLEGLLAEDEKKMILRRLAAAVLIREGVSYRKIGEMLWISPATISSIKKNMLLKNNSHRSHRIIYGMKKDRDSFSSQSKASFADNAIDIVAYLAEGLIKAFLSKGIRIMGDRK